MKRLAFWRRRLRFSLRSLLLAFAVLPAASYYWATLPQRTWNAFLFAAEQGELEQLNAYCDPHTLRFDELPGTKHEFVIWVGGPDSPMFSRTASFTEFQDLQPAQRSFVDCLVGRQRMGTPGSVLFGQLEVRRFHVAFRPQ